MMSQRKYFPVFIFIVYLIATLCLQYPYFSNPLFQKSIIEHYLFSLPVLAGTMFFAFELGKKIPVTEEEYLKHEFLTPVVFFMLGGMINLVVDHNNSDLRAWWSFGLLFLMVYSLFFSAFFAGICWLFHFHNGKYILVFSSLILVFMSSWSWYPRISLGSHVIDSLYPVSLLFLILHVFISVVMRARKTLDK